MIEAKKTQPEKCDITQFACRQLHGVGEQVEKLLKKLNIKTVFDLLLHLPSSYEDQTKITSIRNAKPGTKVLIEGNILNADYKPGRSKSLILHIQDATGKLRLRFFHFNNRQIDQFTELNARIRAFGELRVVNGLLEIAHPRYQILSNDITPLSSYLTPIYPSTAGLKQAVLQKIMKEACQLLIKHPLEEFFSEATLEKFKLLEINQALLLLHQPKADDQSRLNAARNRLAAEELLAQHLRLKTLRQRIINEKSPIFTDGLNKTESFITNLPFQLTHAQTQVWQEIAADLMQAKPMWRLVQGDVGSGKTVIAAIAAFAAIRSGFQAAIMAPTELLAEQHTNNLLPWFKHFSLNAVLLKSHLSAKERRETLALIQCGDAHLIIGTHAIFQENVEFKNLGLIVIDEQHRFGVQQRLALREKSKNLGLFPHQLIMTATPIPRTLAMTAYADLDQSIIDQLPPGRQPIQTLLASQTRREEIIARIENHCSQGKQVYWVCPLIEESEELQCEAATETYQMLQKKIPMVSIGLIHGKLKSIEKDAVMQAFKKNQLQLLVATSVIEVGIDVPNASLIIIENAERLGLAQLHQLRGRVGRGTAQSYCVLLYQAPLSFLAKKRLEVMRQSQDGFRIAEEDLKLRGPGDLLGVQQAGVMQFRIADLSRDQILLASIQQLSQHMPIPAQAALMGRWYPSGKNYAQV